MNTTIRAEVNGVNNGLVRRSTLDWRADVLLDKLERAAPAARPDIAERFFARHGEACAEYPFHVDTRSVAANTLAIELLGGTEDSVLVKRLLAGFFEARDRRDRELGLSRLALHVADIEAIHAQPLLDQEDRGDVIEAAISQAARSLAYGTELSGKEIADALFRAGLREGDCDPLHENRDSVLQKINRVRRERYDDCEAWSVSDLSGDGFYGDDEASESPVAYCDRRAEREHADRRAAAELVVQAAEAEIAGNPSLTIEGLLSKARATATKTSMSGVPGYDLEDRLVAAFGNRAGFDTARVRGLIEQAIDEARNPPPSPEAQAAIAAREIRANAIWARLDPKREPHERLAAFARALAEPLHALVEIEAPSAQAEASATPAAVPGDEAAERPLIALALADIRAGGCDLLSTVREVSRATACIPVEDLADSIIAASPETTPFMHDAIRFSVEETRQAGADYDDALVEALVDKRLAAIYAPITGEPGSVERKAQHVVAAMSPTGAKGPTPFEWTDPHRLPRRPWLYGTLYIRKELTATIAPGGVGKTALTIVEALALASGRDLIGTMPKKRCKVWIWSGEEPLDELKKRILAACEHHQLSAADLTGWLFVDNFESFDFIIAEQTRDGTTIFQPKVDLLTRWLINNGIEALFIDPAISTHNVGENDNVAIQKWATAWKSVAVGANAAVSIAHHAKKLGGQAATADDSRGARSFVDKCRIVRSLAPMSKEDAVYFKLPVEDRRFYFFTDPTESKANMAPAVGGREWFRSHSVVLGKGQFGKYDPGESVGVVDQWTPPKTSDKLDGDTVAAIRAEVAGLTWRAANNLFKQADSIGAPIARALGLDPESPGDMRRIKDTFEKLKTEKLVIPEMVPDQKGTPRPWVRWSDED